MRYWYLFLRYGTALDLYMAHAAGNKAAEIDARLRIAEVDRRLDTLAINERRAA